jgi:hypothetical protein
MMESIYTVYTPTERGIKMDIVENEREWIKATQHEAFVDIVIEAVEDMMVSLDSVITKAVGFDNSLRDNQTEITNRLNEMVAKILFESLSNEQFVTLINSHETD